MEGMLTPKAAMDVRPRKREDYQHVGSRGLKVQDPGRAQVWSGLKGGHSEYSRGDEPWLGEQHVIDGMQLSFCTGKGKTCFETSRCW